VDFYGMESKYQVELNTPLSAQVYLEAEYDIDEVDEKIGLKPLLQKFEGKGLITTATLKETWPQGDWKDDESDNEDNEPTSENEIGSNHSPEVSGSSGIEAEASLSKPAENAHGQAPTTLRDRSMDIFLDTLFDQSQENPELMAEAEILPDFVPKLRQRLYDQAADLKPSTSLLHLLHKALEHDVEVNLSPFVTLTTEYLAVLVARLRNGKMRVLNLSNMPNLTESDLNLVLAEGPSLSRQTESPPSSLAADSGTSQNLKAIILLETPKISIDFLTKHLGHCDIYHSGLLRRPLQPERQDPFDIKPTPALQFSAADAVSQLVWVGVSSMQSCDSKLRRDNGQMDWSGLKYSTEAFSRFSGSEGIKYKNFLMDVPLPGGKLIHSLRRLLRYLTSPNVSWFEDWPKAAARCFATTSTHDNGEGYSVGPLSTTLYRSDDRDDYVESGKGKSPEPGSWAIILVHEAFDAKDQAALDKRELDMASRFGPRGTEGMKEWPEEKSAITFKPLKRLRYALARVLPDSDDPKKQFLVTDVLGYVKHALGADQGKGSEAAILSDWWKQESSDFGDGIDYYRDDDLHDILQKIYAAGVSGEDAESKPRPIDPFEDIMRMMSLNRGGEV